ncbi:SulP family inorganic anion transporter [Haloglycomyces albus]|uniref:SulP family inorganic anion transporter n=1 Tax=Haloglycomyces albus TaxID=526067 RepID=UPI00046CCAD4|nr:SulP family inorganic anion transporter [Haloglycomyces albus]
MTHSNVRATGRSNPFRLLPSVSELSTLRNDWRRNLLAGLTVSIVALPLALGYGIATGVGAGAGLIASIIAGACAAVFGGSNLQVSGPTGAIAVVLVPIVAQYGPGAVYTVGFLAGIILILLALLRTGHLMRYIPEPVIEGFTVGIAVIIFIQQFPLALGLDSSHTHIILEAWESTVSFTDNPNWTALTITLTTTAAMLIGARYAPKWPFAIIAVTTATATTLLLRLDTATVGTLPTTIPTPTLDHLDPTAVPTLLTAAFAIAALASIEGLLSAKVADEMTVEQRHDPNRELFGQGVSNLAAPLFGAIPSSGALARTAVNVRSGASTKLAALSHALILAFFMLALAPFVAHIPLSALAGVLMATSIRMIKVSSVVALCRATRADFFVLTTTAVVTVAVDLIMAVLVGLALAGGTAIHKLAKTLEVNQIELDTSDHHTEEAALLREHIVAYRLEGPLFFAAGHDFLLQFTDIAEVKVVILRMSRVSKIDATGASVLWDAIHRLEKRGIIVLISGLRAEHRQACFALGAFHRLETQGRLPATTQEAITIAREHLRDECLSADPSFVALNRKDPEEERIGNLDELRTAGRANPKPMEYREYPG